MNGSYLLMMELKENKIILVGKSCKIAFNKGFYVYVGSAMNGLEQRIRRHTRKNKKMHWHIDYFLNFAEVIDVFYKENEIKEECIIAKKLEEKLQPIPRFGCSDCNCKSHLFYGTKKEIENFIDILSMNTYHIYFKGKRLKP